jgi:hypothetical protein
MYRNANEGGVVLGLRAQFFIGGIHHGSLSEVELHFLSLF